MMQKKILLVDDEPRVLRALTASLEDDYDITAYHSTSQAQLAINAGDLFDVVITDQEMPTMKGHDFLYWCQKNSPRSKLLLLTGLPVTAELKQKLNGLKRMSIFTKPWDVEKLINAFNDDSHSPINRNVSDETIHAIKSRLLVLDPSKQYRKMYSKLEGKYINNVEYIDRFTEIKKPDSVNTIIIDLNDFENKNALSLLRALCPQANIIVSANPYTISKLQKTKQLPHNVTTLVKPFSLPRFVSHFKQTANGQ